MIIDRGHHYWAVFSGLFLAAAAAWYTVYEQGAPDGPRGSTFEGLTFGIVGTVFILFAALLGIRKKRRHWRVGRAATWLKGHLYFGALAFPLILFHAGFRFGGPLTQALMWLFVFVFLTGIWGLVLQRFLPKLMTKNIPQETVYEQIDHVRAQLFEEAQHMAKGGGGSAAVAKAKAGAVSGRVVKSRVAQEPEEGGEDRDQLIRFVERYMRPYFEHDGPSHSNLHKVRKRTALFTELKSGLPPELHGTADDLQALCEQREQLEVQRRMHHWLHGWLLVHVPCAWAMVFLTVVHAVMALYY